MLPSFNQLSIPQDFYSNHLKGREEGNEAEMKSDASDMHGVFVETSLDTRLTILLHKNENVFAFKEKFRNAHSKLGEITISAVKVKRRCRYYRLSDSMILSTVFAYNSNKEWFIFVDATARAEKTKMASSSNPTDELLEKRIEIASDPLLEEEHLHTQVAKKNKSKKRKRERFDAKKSFDVSPKLCGEPEVDVASQSCAIEKDIVSSESDGIDIKENQQTFSNLDKLIEKKVEIASDTTLEEALTSDAAKEKTKKRKRRSLDANKSCRKKKSDKSLKLCGKLETPKAEKLKTYKVEVASISGKNSTQKSNHPQFEQVSAEEKKNLESLCLSESPSSKVSVTVSNLRDNRLYLPVKISRSDILNEGLDKIIVMDKQGRKWTLGLNYKKLSGEFYITRGWRSFCEANGQKAGCSFIFKLVRDGTSPLLVMNFEDSIF